MRHSVSRRLCAIERALRATIAETQRRQFTYGLRVRSASRDLRHIDLALGFLGGETYCCRVVTCDVPLYREEWWWTLREHLAAEGLRPPSTDITIHVAVISEAGARFPVLGADRLLGEFDFDEEEWIEADVSA